jgi:hypothetical protein
MVECSAGHTFKYDGYPEVEEWISENGNHYDLPVEVCPICNGKAKPILIKRMKSMLVDLGLTVEDLK